MWPKLSKLNTLRNQMLLGFLFIMLIILAFVGGITFNAVSELLKNNAEKHIQQTAVQANGRLESVLDQIDSLTTLVSTNGYVQQLLLKDMHGKPSTFAERQALPPIINLVQMYTDGIKSVELYNKDGERLYPLDGGNLGDKVSEDWIAQTTAKKGGIVWFGIDPSDPSSLLAMRRISLVDQYFSTGGYLLIRADRGKFALKDPLSGDAQAETMLLIARDGQLIASNDDAVSQAEAAGLTASNDQTVAIGSRSFILVKQRSSVTGWTLLILTPVDTITKGISVVRTTIVVSACIGTFLFALFSFFLSTMITRPVFRLIKTMRGTRLGVLKPTASVSSTIEIKELNHSYNQMVGNINGLIQLVYEKELSQSRTELKALQAQIHPHFLFNTLDALYWSLLDKDEDELASYVVAMSDLFRYTITGPNKDEWVALRDELDHIERYLLIMKMRFGDRLAWRIDAPPELADAQLPKLLLQPLVENAILHGLESRIGPGRVDVSVAREGDDVVIAVEDDGAGMDETKLRRVIDGLARGTVPSSKNSGVGIANVQRRLKLYFGEAGESGKMPRLAIQSQKGAGTRVSVRIPANRRSTP
ncbi:sensor histidine kinase [Paenibacillus sp. MWE-103]|uniref:histidine kinase n=1 Tax=Paenibacillus artemisiicola TaxID=1172618 RepID=A0ABS3WH45_9BACL|nr:sensor histidine kinase [Paenibacillus artemisiicola]MBO7747461.1 sensor histidine kinase [Paenibacillus artemisiicola]